MSQLLTWVDYDRPGSDKKIDKVNYVVSEKEVGCDKIDKDYKSEMGDTADRATGFTGQLAALGCTRGCQMLGKVEYGLLAKI